MNTKFAFLVCGFAAFLNLADNARAGESRIVVHLASDKIYDGTSESQGEPVIGLNAEWFLNKSIYIGFEANEANNAGNSDSTLAELHTMGSRQRQRSVGAYLGVDLYSGPSWYHTVSIRRRVFPGSDGMWNTTEFAWQANYNKFLTLNLDFSPDYYELDEQGFGGSASYQRPIGENFFWNAELGFQIIRGDLYDNYEYASLGVGFIKKRFNLSLSYGWNSENGNTLYGVDLIRSPQFVLSLQYLVR